MIHNTRVLGNSMIHNTRVLGNSMIHNTRVLGNSIEWNGKKLLNDGPRRLKGYAVLSSKKGGKKETAMLSRRVYMCAELRRGNTREEAATHVNSISVVQQHGSLVSLRSSHGLYHLDDRQNCFHPNVEPLIDYYILCSLIYQFVCRCISCLHKHVLFYTIQI